MFSEVETRWVFFNLLVMRSGFVALTLNPFDAFLDFLALKIGSWAEARMIHQLKLQHCLHLCFLEVRFDTCMKLLFCKIVAFSFYFVPFWCIRLIHWSIYPCLFKAFLYLDLFIPQGCSDDFFFFIFWEIKCRECLIAYKIYLILVFFHRIFDNLPLDGKGIKLNAALNLWSQGCFEWFRRSFSFGFWGVYWVTIIWAVSYVDRQATVAASALISGSSKKNLNLSISIYH